MMYCYCNVCTTCTAITSAWVNADGSASALTLGDKSTGATSHDFYVLMSVSPSAVGTQSANKVKFSFTYQ